MNLTIFAKVGFLSCYVAIHLQPRSCRGRPSTTRLDTELCKSGIDWTHPCDHKHCLYHNFTGFRRPTAVHRMFYNTKCPS